MNSPEAYMRRCLELAQLAGGYAAPNPLVGAVLVYEDRIIGEGYHELYGKAHAEVNCINSVTEEDRHLIPLSTIYVSLEPCAHFGKTPPCADLILAMKIPRVVVGCRDPFPQVNGKGIEKLLVAGVEVTIGVLEKECISLNKRFFTFNTAHRPFIVLKWAQSANGRIAGADSALRTIISNDYANRLVHKWRSEEAAILVGTRTAIADDPALTVRLWNGPDPIRLVIDKELQLPASLRLFDRKVRTIVFNTVKHGEEAGQQGGGENVGGTDSLFYYQLGTDRSIVHLTMLALHQLKIQSVLVEGGARLLQSFIDEGHWDEARIITNNELELPGGLPAPILNDPQLLSHEVYFTNTIRYYKNPLSLS